MVKRVSRDRSTGTKRGGSPRRTGRPVRASRRRKAAARAKRPAVPALPDIEGYVRGLPPPIKVIVSTLRRIVCESAPEATELLFENGPAYDADGLFARIETRERSVLLEFLKGDRLDAPAGVLEPGLGAERHVTITARDEVQEAVLRRLVRQAVFHHFQTRPTPPAPPASSSRARGPR